MAMKKFQMLNIICDSCELTAKEKLVAQYFVYKSNQAGVCYPSVNTIAKQCGASERTIQRATKKLQQKGYIVINKRSINGKQTSNEYVLVVNDLDRLVMKNEVASAPEEITSINSCDMKLVSFENYINEAEIDSKVNTEILLENTSKTDVDQNNVDEAIIVSEQQIQKDASKHFENIRKTQDKSKEESITKKVKANIQLNYFGIMETRIRELYRIDCCILILHKLICKYNFEKSIIVVINHRDEVKIQIIIGYFEEHFFMPFLGVPP